jgi:hypothetical protein
MVDGFVVWGAGWDGNIDPMAASSYTAEMEWCDNGCALMLGIVLFSERGYGQLVVAERRWPKFGGIE